jgi:hypothetical protein
VNYFEFIELPEPRALVGLLLLLVLLASGSGFVLVVPSVEVPEPLVRPLLMPVVPGSEADVPGDPTEAPPTAPRPCANASELERAIAVARPNVTSFFMCAVLSTREPGQHAHHRHVPQLNGKVN